MRKAALLLLFVLLISVTVPCAHAEERLELVSAFWGNSNQPIDARPGYSKLPLTLVLQNKYSYMIIGIYAELSLPEGFHNVTGGNVTSAAFGPSLPPGGVATLTFLIDIDKDVKPGNYTFHVWMDYFDSVYSEMEDEFNFTLTVKPPVKPELASVGWGTPQKPMKPTPGSDGVPLYIWINNPDKSPIYGINLTLSLPEGISGPNGEKKVWTTIPTIEAGQSTVATFLLDIAEERAPNPAEFKLNIEYLDHWSARFETEESFTLPIYAKPKISIIIGDLRIEQGSSAMFNVTVVNSGSAEVYDVFPTLQVNGLIVLHSPTEKVDILRPDENATFTFELYAPSNLPPSSIPVGVVVSYKDERGIPNAKSGSARADVLLSDRSVDITVSTSEIRYQRMNEVTLEIKNRSDRPLQDVEISLTPPTTVPLYVKEGVGPWRFDTLEPGSSGLITLHVLPFSQAEGAIPIIATVTYTDGGSTRTETQTLLFHLKGYIDITLVNWKFSPSPAYNGSVVSFSASLLNRGTQQAYYTRVYVKAESPIAVGRMSDKYIGDLPTNSPTPFNLKFDVSPSASPGSYKVQVVVEYTDALGQVHELSQPFELKVVIGHSAANAEKAEKGGFMAFMNQDVMIIIILLALLIVTVVWGYRRGRREVEEEIEAV